MSKRRTTSRTARRDTFLINCGGSGFTEYAFLAGLVIIAGVAFVEAMNGRSEREAAALRADKHYRASCTIGVPGGFWTVSESFEAYGKTRNAAHRALRERSTNPEECLADVRTVDLTRE